MARSRTSSTLLNGSASLLAALLVTAGAAAAVGTTASPSSEALVKAVSHGDCDAAVRLANQDAQSGDARVFYLVGRMVDEGVCVAADGKTATAWFQRAAALGLPDAVREYAVQVGLGEGVEQSYEKAGDLCQKGGLQGSPETPGASEHPSAYSLGYACTVGGVASRLLRESLPSGAFVPDTGVTQVSFNPATGAMQIRATPRVTRTREVITGTYLTKAVFDPRVAIGNAWRQALANVPKPDTTRLTNEGVDLTLDLDTTVEGPLRAKGAAHTAPSGGFFLPGEIHATTGPH
jgi:hypothetical protein